MNKVIKNLKEAGKNGIGKTKEAVKNAGKKISNNKREIVINIAICLVFPAPTVPAIILLRENYKKKKRAKKSATNKEGEGKPDSSFSFPQICYNELKTNLSCKAHGAIRGMKIET